MKVPSLGMPKNMGVTTGARPPKQEPPRDARRPPEPLRPAPAVRPGTGLLAAKVRRRRYRIG